MTPAFILALVLHGLLQLLVALTVLLAGPREGPLGLERVAAAIGALTVVGVVEVLVLLPFGLSPFGLIHLVWIDASVVLPLSGAAVLVAARRGRKLTRPVAVLAWTSLLAVPAAGQALFVTPFDLRVERTAIRLDPARTGTEPVTIGVLADLQTTAITDFERGAVARLMEGSPDLILVPGDLYQGLAHDLDDVIDGFHELLASADTPAGTWVVSGNTDVIEELPRILAGTGATLLENEIVRLSVGDRKLSILGLHELGYDSWPERLAEFAAEPGSDDIRIVLVHRPRAVLDLPGHSRIDLVVAGHTHGGQVALPLLGPPLVLSPLPNRIAAGGLHELDGNALYISRGLGMEREQAPRIRFGVPPEVTLLTLE